MKPGSIALNPHASSYVPLSKRVDYADIDGLVFSNPPTHIVQGQELSFSGVEVSIPNKSFEMTQKQIKDDDLDMEMDMDMDIEYLLVTFPGLSQESITDVYLANSGDLEETIEMLNQLETSFIIYSNEAQETLPEKLDIGDSSTSKASKQKNVATEIAGSSSLVIPSAHVSA